MHDLEDVRCVYELMIHMGKFAAHLKYKTDERKPAGNEQALQGVEGVTNPQQKTRATST